MQTLMSTSSSSQLTKKSHSKK